jgi:hypothetical protein
VASLRYWPGSASISGARRSSFVQPCLTAARERRLGGPFDPLFEIRPLRGRDHSGVLRQLRFPSIVGFARPRSFRKRDEGRLEALRLGRGCLHLILLFPRRMLAVPFQER